MASPVHDRVTIIADGKKISCSKTELGSRSEYFYAMFNHDFKEKEKNEITLKEVDADCLEDVIQMVDPRKLRNPLKALELCLMFLFNSDKKKIIHFISTEWLSTQNCLEIVTVCDKFQCHSLYNKALSIALYEFENVYETVGFQKLYFEGVLDYLGNPGLRVEYEYEVFLALEYWISYDYHGRCHHITDLLKTVRFVEMSLFSLHLISGNVLIQHDQVLSLFMDFLRFHHKNLNKMGPIEVVAKNLPQKCIEHIINMYEHSGRIVPTAPCLLVYIPHSNQGADRKAKQWKPCIYYKDENTWALLTHVKELDRREEDAMGYNLIGIGFKLYFVGGEYRYGYGKWILDVWSYNVVHETWNIETRMPKPRRNVLLCNIDKIIYLIGGVGRHRVVANAITSFNTVTKVWKDCIILKDATSVNACCAFKGKIYLFSASVDLYDPQTNSTTLVFKYFPDSCGCAAALPYKDNIYVIGSGTSMVFKFDPLCANPVMTYVALFGSPDSLFCLSNQYIYNTVWEDGQPITERLNLENLGITKLKMDLEDSWLPGSELSSRICFTITKYTF